MRQDIAMITRRLGEHEMKDTLSRRFMMIVFSKCIGSSIFMKQNDFRTGSVAGFAGYRLLLP